VDDLTEPVLACCRPGDFQIASWPPAIGRFWPCTHRPATRDRDQFLVEDAERVSARDSGGAPASPTTWRWAVSHEQLAEARARWPRRMHAGAAELRVRTLADELDLKAGHGRAVGQIAGMGPMCSKKATQVASTTRRCCSWRIGHRQEVVARLFTGHRRGAAGFRRDQLRGPARATPNRALRLRARRVYRRQQAKPGQSSWPRRCPLSR